MAVTKQAKPEGQGVAGRRSSRLSITIPIAIKGKDSSGHEFKENTRTLVINKHGAKIATVHQLSLGAELVVENRASGQSAKGNVVWLGEKRSTKEPCEVGLQLVDAQNIWGIEFPPEDWQEGGPAETAGPKAAEPAAVRAAEAAAPKVPAKTPELRPPRVSEMPAATKAAVKTPEPLPATAAKPAAPSAPAPAAGVTKRLAPSGEAGIPLEKLDMVLEAASARFNAQAEEVAERQAKHFEERLARLTNQIGLQTQQVLQEGANQIQENVMSGLEQRSNELMNQLQAARAEVEALVNKIEELAKSTHSTVVQSQTKMQDASRDVLQFAIEELNEKAQQELKALSSGFLEQTRKRLEEEAASNNEKLHQKAQQELKTFSAEFLAQTRKRVEEEAASEIEKLSEKTRKEVEGVAAKAVLQAHKRIEEETSSEIENLTDRAREELKTFSSNFVEQTRKRLQEEASTAVQNLMKKDSGEQVAALTRQVTERLHKATDDLLEASAKQLQKQAEDTLEMLSVVMLKDWTDQSSARLQKETERVEASAKTAVEAFQKQTEELTNANLERLRKQAETLAHDTAEAFRAKLGEIFAVFQPGGKKS